MCEGRKVLVFFQHRKTMDLVLDDLALDNDCYLRIDSTIIGEKRGEIAKRFNTGAYSYLFMSTSCGVLELYLTYADTVVFYEHDWNQFSVL